MVTLRAMRHPPIIRAPGDHVTGTQMDVTNVNDRANVIERPG